MKTYTVIWRDTGDEFMFTDVSLEGNPNGMSTWDWIELAAAIEYIDFATDEYEEIMKGLLERGYDLLAVVVGPLTHVI